MSSVVQLPEDPTHAPSLLFQFTVALLDPACLQQGVFKLRQLWEREVPLRLRSIARAQVQLTPGDS